MIDPTRKQAHDKLVERAQRARELACEMMTNGSREYQRIKELVDEYVVYQYAADAITGQTDTGLGDLDG